MSVTEHLCLTSRFFVFPIEYDWLNVCGIVSAALFNSSLHALANNIIYGNVNDVDDYNDYDTKQQ